MSKPLRNQPLVVARRDDPSLAAETKDAAMLLRESVAHLETAMRLIAQATLLHPALDESVGIEAQRLIGVRQVLRSEIRTVERHRYQD